MKKDSGFKRIFKKKSSAPPDFGERRRRDEEKLRKALAEKGISPEISGSVLDLAHFDLDNDNKKVKGIAAVTEKMLVSVRWEKDGETLRNVTAVELSKVKGISLRGDFGVYAAEATLENGDVSIIGRVSAKDGKRISKFFKRAELFLTDSSVYERKKEEPPAVCPKCGKPLRHGSKVCDKCIDRMGLFKRLMSIAAPHKGTLAVVTFVYILAMGLSMVVPYIQRIMVDDFINSQEMSVVAKETPSKVIWPFLGVILLLLAANVVSFLVNRLRNLTMMKMGIDVVIDLRTRLFDKVQAMSLAGVSRRTTGELMNRISQDASMLQNFINSWIPNFLSQVLLLVGVSVVLAFYDPVLLAIFIVPVMVTLPAISFFHKKIHKIYGKQWEATSKSGAVLHDILSGIRVVKAFGTEAKESRRYSEAAERERDLAIRNEVLFAKLQPFIRGGLLIGNFLLLYYTGDKILGNALTIGEASMISSYVNIVYGPLWWLANFPSHMNRTLVSANRVFEVLDEEIDINDNSNAVDRVIDGNITFENVCFGYDETQQVLKNVSLEIKPGEMIGLVGRSGVGKSTLINLIMRLYEVESGSIKIDGIDIKDYSQECLRSQVGVVLQETILFSGSLYDNVAYAKEGATKAEVLAAARAAGVHEFAVKLPDGYNTRIGEKGYTLSGGERQRVAIARAILRNPRILILDEATASLDTEMEKQIQEALEVLVKDRTTVAIAHRLSTLRNAAKIVVLDKGTVAEVGSHEELLRKKGIYYELVMAQRQMATKQKAK